MCQLCADAMERYWPNATKEEQSSLLWEATAFPMCDGPTTARQLREASEESGQDVGLAIALAYAHMDAAMDNARPRRFAEQAEDRGHIGAAGYWQRRTKWIETHYDSRLAKYKQEARHKHAEWKKLSVLQKDRTGVCDAAS